MLSPEQQLAFEKDGFIVIPGLVPAEMCAVLRDAADAWVEAGEEIARTGEPLFHHTRVPTSDGTAIVHVEQIHRFGRIESLELAGLPDLREMVEKICGPEVVWTYEGLNIRRSDVRKASQWLQGAVYERENKAVCVVVFIDPTDDSGYQFLPGSQKEKQDICAIERDGASIASAESIAKVNTGDVLVYDPMLVQLMKPYEGSDQARTIELWFQAQEISKSHFTENWIQQRKRLYGLASWTHQKLDAARYGVAKEAIKRREDIYNSIKPDIDSIYEEKVVYPSANFCLDFKSGDRIVSN